MTAFGALAASCLLPERVSYKLYEQYSHYTVAESTRGAELTLAMLSPGRGPMGPIEIAKVSFHHYDEEEARNYHLRGEALETAYLQYAGVLPEYRNCGLGEPLLDEFRRTLVFSGVQRVHGDFYSRRIVRLMERVFGPMVYAEDSDAGHLRPKEVMTALPEVSPEQRVPGSLTRYPFINGPRHVSIWYNVI